MPRHWQSRLRQQAASVLALSVGHGHTGTHTRCIHYGWLVIDLPARPFEIWFAYCDYCMHRVVTARCAELPMPARPLHGRANTPGYTAAGPAAFLSVARSSRGKLWCPPSSILPKRQRRIALVANPRDGRWARPLKRASATPSPCIITRPSRVTPSHSPSPCLATTDAAP